MDTKRQLESLIVSSAELARQLLELEVLQEKIEQAGSRKKFTSKPEAAKVLGKLLAAANDRWRQSVLAGVAISGNNHQCSPPSAARVGPEIGRPICRRSRLGAAQPFGGQSQISGRFSYR